MFLVLNSIGPVDHWWPNSDPKPSWPNLDRPTCRSCFFTLLLLIPLPAKNPGQPQSRCLRFRELCLGREGDGGGEGEEEGGEGGVVLREEGREEGRVVFRGGRLGYFGDCLGVWLLRGRVGFFRIVKGRLGSCVFWGFGLF